MSDLGRQLVKDKRTLTKNIIRELLLALIYYLKRNESFDKEEKR